MHADVGAHICDCGLNGRIQNTKNISISRSHAHAHMRSAIPSSHRWDRDIQQSIVFITNIKTVICHFMYTNLEKYSDIHPWVGIQADHWQKCLSGQEQPPTAAQTEEQTRTYFI